MTKDQEAIVNTAIENPTVLTDYEYDFINDIADNDETMNGYALSESQNRVLERINDKLVDANII